LFLVGQFLKIFSSETALPNEPKLDWKVLYRDCSFRFDGTETNETPQQEKKKFDVKKKNAES
jgi:hypothetical protein